jgi:hypothetical protein
MFLYRNKTSSTRNKNKATLETKSTAALGQKKTSQSQRYTTKINSQDLSIIQK